MRFWIQRALAVGLIGGLAACRGGASPTAPPNEITVFAAASLTEAFQEIAWEFQRTHPGVQVAFQFAGSSALRTQLAQGAKADVFASADEANMRRAQQDGAIASEPRPFARNELILVVPADNPAGIGQLRDLARPGVRLVLAAKDVPIGRYARQILEKASRDPGDGGDFRDRVLRNVVSEEANVRTALAKVVLGEADATFVYRTDVVTGMQGKVRVIEIPAEYNVTVEYYIAIVKGAPNPMAAQAFVDFVLSPSGQQILARWGFRPVR